MENILNELFPSILELLLPEGIEKEITVGENKVTVSKKDGKFEMEIKNNSEIDDSKIKEEIKTFKKAIAELDDDLFVRITEHVGELINLNKFSDLLNQTNFKRKEIHMAYDLMSKFNNLFEDFMNDSISWMQNQRDHYLDMIG